AGRSAIAPSPPVASADLSPHAKIPSALATPPAFRRINPDPADRSRPRCATTLRCSGSPHPSNAARHDLPPAGAVVPLQGPPDAHGIARKIPANSACSAKNETPPKSIARNVWAHSTRSSPQSPRHRYAPTESAVRSPSHPAPPAFPLRLDGENPSASAL